MIEPDTEAAAVDPGPRSAGIHGVPARGSADGHGDDLGPVLSPHLRLVRLRHEQRCQVRRSTDPVTA